ncbi:MAG TPA: glycosyltransferase 87 family protein [Acidimicrobiales bacterium]|nr:glycosyltransferase 87 family protein [Acidimicrobiales bacterium]
MTEGARAVARVGRPGVRREAGSPGADHLGAVEPRLVVALFTLFAVYAGALAIWSKGAESVWAEWAAAGYGATAVFAAAWWRRRPGVPLLAAALSAFVVPAALLPPTWGATSEVRVVARAASLWLAHGTPYLTSGHLTSWKSYDPYLPGMSLFGVPHAAGFPGALGDPLIWLALATTLLFVASCRIAAPDAARRCRRCRRQTLLRAVLVLVCPLFALPMALGVTDPPVIALVCLGLACVARSSDGGHTPDAPVLGLPVAPPDGHGAARDHGRPGAAGLSIGVACALKATAWPAFPVVLALLAVRDGRRAASRFALGALASFFVLVTLTAPALLAHPEAFWQNLVEYPLGIARSVTQAASPLPGHLLAREGSLGHLAAIVLLGAAALVLGASLLRRPPRDVRQASFRLALGLVAVFLFAPDARFGYFAYPLGILAWLLVTMAQPRRRRADTPRLPADHVPSVRRALTPSRELTRGQQK